MSKADVNGKTGDSTKIVTRDEIYMKKWQKKQVEYVICHLHTSSEFIFREE